MIKSIYNPNLKIISAWNVTSQEKHLNYYLADLDSNLTFSNGWINFPPFGYCDIDISYFNGPLGFRIYIYEGDELIYTQDYYWSEELPQNYFYSNPRDVQYGSWESLQFHDDYEGLIEFKETDVVYDLGANVGVFTKWLLNKFNNIEHIYAFEPTPHLVGYMNKTFSIYPNVTIFNKAISNKNKTAVFQTFQNSVSNTLIDFDDKNHTYSGGVEVECVNLEQFINQNNLLQPTLLKIDIEGSEYDLVNSSSDEFLSNIPKIILEFHRNYDGEVWSIIKRLLNLDFKVKVVPNNYVDHPMGTIIFTK